MFKKFDFRYFLLQLHVNNIFRLHFRKYIINGDENIPQDKPVIFAPTHRNALIDALILVRANMKKQVVFLGRADIFKSRLIVSILTYLRIMPVYRLRDGKENLQKNQEIFQICSQILQQNIPLCLFPEAKHNPHQNLLPLQKAIPRIALPTEAVSGFSLDTHIIPVSFYYTNKDSFLSDLYITYGKPVKVADYKELYMQDENMAINQLRLDLDARLREYVVDIPEEDYDEISALIDVNVKTLTDNSFPESDGLVHASQEIIRNLKKLKEKDPQQYSDKISGIRSAVETLKSNRISSVFPIAHPKNFAAIFIRALLLVMVFPLAFAGLLNTLIPVLIYKKLLTVVKDKQFISTVRLVTGIFVVPLLYIIQAIIVSVASGNPMYALIYLLASPVLFYFGSYWRKWWRELNRMETVRQFRKKNHGKDWENIMAAMKTEI